VYKHKEEDFIESTEPYNPYNFSTASPPNNNLSKEKIITDMGSKDDEGMKITNTHKVLECKSKKTSFVN